MVLVNTGLRRAIGAGINKGLSFFAPLKTQLTLARGTGDPTFTRATTAYVKDFEDVWRQVPSGAARFEGARVVRNLLDKSQNLGGGSWVLLGTATRTSGITDPLGGTTAWQLDMPADGDGLRNTGCTLPAGAAVYSLWLRADSAGTISVQSLAGNQVPLTTFNVTTEWKRFSTTAQPNAVADSNYWIRRNGTTLTKVYIAFVLAESVTGQSNQNPSEYVSVGVLSAPYHGAGVDGVKYFDTENGNTVASGVVTEATGAAIADATLDGYLVEGQRQNRCLYSQDFTNAAWVSGGGGIAVTSNTAVAPDGTTTADTLTASGANGTLIQDLGVVASADKVGGLYLKRKTGTGNVYLTMDGGATFASANVTSSWALYQKYQNMANEDFGIRIDTPGDEVYAWQAQVETAAFISSPILTTTAAVTRSADSLTYPVAGNIAAAEGAVYMEADKKGVPNGGTHGFLTLGGGLARYPLYNNSSDYQSVNIYDGTNATSKTESSMIGVQKKMASSWSASSGELAITMSGLVPATTSFVGDMVATNTTINIGNNASYANIRNVKIWKTAKTDAQLQDLTT